MDNPTVGYHPSWTLRVDICLGYLQRLEAGWSGTWHHSAALDELYRSDDRAHVGAHVTARCTEREPLLGAYDPASPFDACGCTVAGHQRFSIGASMGIASTPSADAR